MLEVAIIPTCEPDSDPQVTHMHIMHMKTNACHMSVSITVEAAAKHMDSVAIKDSNKLKCAGGQVQQSDDS